jgi:hypothetical protein
MSAARPLRRRSLPLGGTAAAKAECPAACRPAAASAHACAGGTLMSATRFAIRLGTKGAR